MDLAALAVYATCLALSFVSAVFPFVNAEVVLIGYVVAAGSTTRAALVFAALASIGQMVGKAVMYWTGRGAARVPSERTRRTLARWESRLRRSPRSMFWLVLLSASAGFPPFYVVSILAGTFRTNFVYFLAAGLVGRFARFLVIALFPAGIASLR